jgi:hypothetical protein
VHRDELIRRLVLDEICNDYENVDQIILPSVAREAAGLGVTVARVDVVHAMTSLIASGLARAYLLASKEPFVVPLEGMPPVDAIEAAYRTYFYATDDGRRVAQEEPTV